MRIRPTWSLALLGLIVSITTACSDQNSASSNTSSDTAAPPVSLFEVDASRVENHAYPDDLYLDRAFLPAQGVPLLATPTIRAAFSIAEANRIGGFTLAQAGAIDLVTQTVAVPGDASFLVQLGTTAQVAFPSSTPIRFPFSAPISEASAQTENVFQIYDLGVPVYNPTSPQSPPTLVAESALRSGDTVPIILTILGGGSDGNTNGGALPSRTASDLIATTATAVAVGEVSANRVTKSVTIRPREPFRTTPIDREPTNLGLHTYAVLVRANVLSGLNGGSVGQSTQWQATFDSNVLSGLSSAEQAAVTRHVTDTTQGFGLVSTASGLSRSDLLSYVQVTVADDTLQLQILRDVIRGELNVDQRLVGGSQSATINVGGSGMTNPFGIRVAGTNGLDETAATGDEPQTITGAASIEAFFQRIFGPWTGTSVSVTSSVDLVGDSSSVVTVDPTNLNGRTDVGVGLDGGSLTNGTLIVNPGMANEVAYAILSATETSITVTGNIVNDFSNSQNLSFLALRPGDDRNSPLSLVPQAGIGRIVRGFMATPNFRSFNFPSDPTSPTASPVNPLISQTFMGTAFVTAVVNNASTTAQLTAAVQPFSTTNIIAQFPQEVVNRSGAFQAQANTPPSLNGRRLTNQLPYILFLPASTEPGTGYPVVIGVHGFSRKKEDLCGLASALNSAGQALIAVDITQHGERQNQDGANGATRLVDPTISALNTPRIPFPDPFINPTLLARSRDRLRQAQADLLCLIRAIEESGNMASPNSDFDPAGGGGLSRTSIKYIGQSLGAIVGTQLTAVSPSIDRAVLNVPGGGIMQIIKESRSIAPSIDGLLLATANIDVDLNNPNAIFALLAGSSQRMVSTSAIREVYDASVQAIVAPVDPLSYSRQALASAGLNLRTTGIFNGNPVPSAPADVFLQFVPDDGVVPQNANSRLARGLGVGNSSLVQLATPSITFPNPTNPTENITTEFPILFDMGLVDGSGASRMTDTTPFTGSGIIQYPSTHGFILDPSTNLTATAGAQTQAATFLASPTPTIP